MKKKILRLTAKTLLLAMVYQLTLPVCSFALTTGPSQPEVQSFEPVGTTDMVNTFTGDFTYNIPLLDVEGYPVNISYHSGVTMEQESTWCGLGWNINPGEINRNVRGMPDDFKGETIEREVHIEAEKNVRVGVGANLGAEILGKNIKDLGIGLSLSLGMYLNYNNYRGLSAGTNAGLSMSTPIVSAGVDMGIGSQSGADVDINASATISGKLNHDMAGGITVGVGTGFNSRQGLKDLGFNVSASMKSTVQVEQQDRTKPANADGSYPAKMDKNSQPRHNKQQGGATSLYGSSVRIGLQNYVPVVTNRSIMNAFSFQLKGGGEISMLFPNLFFNAHISNTTYEEDGSRSGYGYLYSEGADKYSIMDFSRDKDGIFNRTLNNLPSSVSTYDIYTVSGQGTGGSFRPFRNDVGTFFDPFTESTANTKDVQPEYGIGNLFEAGADMCFYDNYTETGPWTTIPYRSSRIGKLFEKVFFKSGGEFTYNHQLDNNSLFNGEPIYVKEDGLTLANRSGGNAGNLPTILGSENDRTARANFITYLTASEASAKDIAASQKLTYFADNGSGNSRFFDPVEQVADRYSNNSYNLRDHQIGEFTQTLPDGRRYVYGLPALNHMSREVTFSVDESKANLGTGLVKFTAGSDDTKDNSNGTEHYYNSTATPAHAHSYLLTSVLSTDYVDVLGDGPTDDDLGSFAKFNYKRWNDDYRWRAPYQSDSAQYNTGFWSDIKDGKGSYTVGSRQVWQIRSIESKNHVAEFYVSPRNDGKGVTSAVLPVSSKMTMPSGIDLKTTTTAGNSFKLDSIKLYNKHDRYVHENNAVPIKTVIFKYDYSLCKNIPNTSVSGEGKLTLKNIYIRYGNSDKNLLSPYSFTYNSANPNYSFLSKDRWGCYKPATNNGVTNYEYPYAAQTGEGVDSAAAWNMTDIKLPSGGNIHVDYECKDYAFVQDRRAMQMFMVAGFGTTTKFERKNNLYENTSVINDYVYFRRDKSKEVKGLTLAENYLERQDMLYYNFSIDITGTGKYESIKSYAKIDAVDSCPNNSDYAYIKLKRDEAGNMHLHPATIYGINTARQYLPHILYPGSGDGSDVKNIVTGLLGAAEELRSIWQNPFVLYTDRNNAKRVKIEKSWIRLQSPGLSKKGSGIRVKKIILEDKWSNMVGTSGVDASYGKVYDYTVEDARYGRISSGVASYEPLIGGDENPFRKPAASYQTGGGKLLPSIDFFQEEPFGESFFPSPVVGYSSVKVKSIHASEGKSAQSEDEYLYYTAKDFPIEVAYSQKDAPGQKVDKTLRLLKRVDQVLQGYVFKFNDMHGKPRATNNYVIKTDGTVSEPELITGTKYNYNVDDQGRLSNRVRALVRNRGSVNSFDIKDNVILGQEGDISIDSRSNHFRSFTRRVQANVNATIYGIVPVVIPTVFMPDKEEIQDFKMMVTTQVIQKYGIVKSIERYDHGAITTQESLIFDSESGDVILSRVGNEFKENLYDLVYPAHLAYQGMGPAYMNVGYEEIADSLVDNPLKGQLLYPKNRSAFSFGDELLITYTPAGASERTVKVWAQGILNAGASCPLVVLPRFISEGSSFNWPDWTGKLTNVHVKIVRSGRRNMLKSIVQQATLAENPYQTSINDLLGGSAAFNKVLSLGGTFYSGTNSLYGGEEIGANYQDVFASTTGNCYGMNGYVSGRLGNFRPRETYNSIESRLYEDGHVRYDGTFPVIQQAWSNVNNGSLGCRDDHNILKANTGFNYQSNYAYLYSDNNRGSMVTNSDPFGNVMEDLNLQGHSSAAQYGYNAMLPVAIASNANQTEFFFDGFESYAMMQSENIRFLRFASAYLFTPFASLFVSPKTLTGLYSSTNTSVAGFNSSINIRRGGQNYSILDSRAFIGGSLTTDLVITDEASHSGFYALKSTAGVSVPIKAQQANAHPADLQNAQGSSFNWTINRFHLPVNKKCVINAWVRPVSSSSDAHHQITLTIGSNSTPLRIKTSNIDGWYLAEAVISDNSSGTPTITLDIPAGVYIDDIRMQPIDASMKSFVYNPYTLKLMAQLDEGHVSTFYEYDQEGMLIRTKRETSQGVKTVSESRRSSAKK